MSHPITALIPFLKTDDQQQIDWLTEMVKSLPRKMPYLVAVNTGKHEMHEALNLALAQVETSHVIALGADDKCDRGMIDRLWSAIGTADVAYPSMRVTNEKGRTLVKAPADVASIHQLQDQNLCGVFLARTEALREVGGWRDEAFEDWDLMRRLADNGARFVSVPNAWYMYRRHEDTLSVRIWAESKRQGFDARDVAPGNTERRQMLATWYVGSSAPVSYVRALVPAKQLPGVATDRFDKFNRYATPAAIFQHPNERLMWDEAAAQGRVRIIDVDDNYLSPQLIRNMRKLYGETAGGWQDGQARHREMVREADGVICSTIPLAETYADLNPNVHVIPNMVDPDDWSEIHPLRLDDKIRVVWPAGKQHGPDAVLVEGAMRWASKQPNVEVMTIGLDPGWRFAYHHEPFTPSGQTYRDILSLADIVVAPVRPNDLTRCKSDIKWLEAAMVGAPLICSAVAAYTTVEHGETGFVCKGAADFVRYMKLLVRDEDERLRVGRAACEQVMATRHAVHSRLAYMQLLQTCGVGQMVNEEVAA